MSSKVGFLYLGDKYKEEEKLIAENFVTVRTNSVFDEINDVSKLQNSDYVILRGTKLSQEVYEKTYTFLQQKNKNVYSPPASYKIANSAVLYSKLLGSKAPLLYVFPSGKSDNEIISSFNNDVKFPLFVRSEKESAAKYVGVNGCIILNNNSELFKIALCNLRKNVKEFNEIIFKQVVPIKQNSKNLNLEYRAIIFRGKLISFDYDEQLSNPSDYRLDQFVIEVATDLFRKGFDGGYFMDFAIKEDGSFFVVECKDLINGTIKNIDRLINGLKKEI